jgi:motility quorum-sensing regulator / GCU-specific mRNA interferase toxin
LKKYKSHYPLEKIKGEFSSVDRLAITRTARQDATKLGFSASDIIEVIQSIERGHFYKSMTSNHNHQIWQDVYHVPVDDDLVLYVKFSEGVITEFMVLSFKEK